MNIFTSYDNSCFNIAVVCALPMVQANKVGYSITDKASTEKYGIGNEYNCCNTDGGWPLTSNICKQQKQNTKMLINTLIVALT